MCSINGCFIFEEGNNKEISERLKNILILSEDRGRDSFGFCFIGEQVQTHKFSEKSSEVLKNIDFKIPENTKIILSNNRAEPTTEFIEFKKQSDVQPFTTEKQNIYIVHNGTIANDKDLIKEYNIEMDTKIDSAVIPYVLEKIWDGTTENLNYILRNKIIGSYSLAIYNREIGDKLYLATNYKPLYIMFNAKENTLYFSSLENYLDKNDYESIYGDSTIKIVKPYTLLEIDNKGNINSSSLYNKDYIKDKKKKALIIASGGLDSTVCASWALEQGYDIELLHFKYQCRAENAEIKAINNLKEFFNCKLTEIPIDFFKNIIGGSRLTNPESNGDLMKDGDGEASAELAWEWVPARNLIFMSIVSGYAEAHDFDYIILGGNLEESGSYSDNELIFLKKFNELLPHALNLQNKVEVLTPIANLMKHEIVKLGLELNAPLHLTWSCYENQEIPCGKCGPDYMRKVAFRMNGYVDPIKYEHVEKDFFTSCKKINFNNRKWEEVI